MGGRARKPGQPDGCGGTEGAQEGSEQRGDVTCLGFGRFCLAAEKDKMTRAERRQLATWLSIPGGGLGLVSQGGSVEVVLSRNCVWFLLLLLSWCVALLSSHRLMGQVEE